ncbi:MAG: hypothetical protein IPH46_07475 [Bacteroidetes bacterium]|nr:hypothetical protein [Bacteroidota bacterium]
MSFLIPERNELMTIITTIKVSFKESFKRITGDYTQIRNELNQIKKKIKDAESNKEDLMVTEFRRQKEELDRDVIILNGTIDSLNREIGEYNNQKLQKVN